MAICSHCRSTIFSRASRHAARGPHHTDISNWRASVANACAVCALLLQHLVAAIKDALAQKTASAPWTPPDKEANRERDDAVRNRAPEDLLLAQWDALTKEIYTGIRDDDFLPIYECSVQDAGGRKAWILKFQPSSGGRIRRQDEVLELDIKPQKFFVYDANYDNTRGSSEVASESHRPLASRTDSVETFKQINRWTDICEKTHEHCRPLFETPGDDAYVPKRLLDVGTLESPRLKLVETDNKRPAEFRPYITLSYKWGYEADYVLEKSTRERYINEGLPEMELPVTFREAVEATRRLDKKYLWIDALCMLQKDPDEWLEECPKMQKVYGNSFLSLAAVSADNYVQGLFRTRRSDGLPPSSVTVQWEHQTTTCCLVREDLWRGEVLSEPLFTRGWVLQERLLAPRILHFQRRQVFWQCPTLTACEGAPAGLSEVVTDERLEELRWRQLLHREKTVELDADQKTDMHETWRFAVQSYTTCNLTKSGDKLMAIASMASRMKEVFNEGYFAGLWERRFVEQLAWRVSDFRMPSLDPAYRAPSWSWASVDSIVSLPERIRYKRVYTMTVPKNGINVVLEKPENVTGTLHFASLTAETELHKLTFSSAHDAHQTGKAWSWAFDDGQQRNEWCQFFPDKLWGERFDLDLDEVETSQHPSDPRRKIVRFTAAMLAYSEDLGSAYDEAGPSYSGIALALSRARAGRAKVYCRVGLIEFRSVGGKAWEDIQAARVSTSRKEGEVAASDKRGRYIHVITLL